MSVCRFLQCLFLLSIISSANAATIRFSSDFDSAVDTGGGVSDSGYVLNHRAGDTSLVNGALEFNLAHGNYEQVSLSLGGTDKIYRVEFDLMTRNLANSEHSFSLNFDTPTVQNLNFNNCCSNRVTASNPYASDVIRMLGYLADDQSMHVSIEVNLLSSLWSIDVSGVGSGTGGFYSKDGGIESLRFGLSTAKGGTLPDPSVYVEMDNLVVVSEVPLPATMWLLGTAIISLVGFRRADEGNG